MFQNIFRYILRRKTFKGQFKLFLWLFNQQKLRSFSTISQPLHQLFKIYLQTGSFIDACIYFTGDYEPYLKHQFKQYITPGMTVLDVGANIGFHSLYFAELTGPNGLVLSFEPIPRNFTLLEKNVDLNSFHQIQPFEIALGGKNELIRVHIPEGQNNPGAYNLFQKEQYNTEIICRMGDDFLDEHQITDIGFIKIDVEGYEYFVINGLKKTIEKSKPVLIFEYDRNYQLKAGVEPVNIFDTLATMGYCFYEIDGYGNKKPFTYANEVMGAEILAIQKK